MAGFPEFVRCEHGKICFIKIGLKPTGSYLKSFYVCSARKERCNFSREAVELKPLKCFVHSDEYVDLYVPFIDESSKKKQIKYRCCKHETSWCGLVAMELLNSSATTQHIKLTADEKPLCAESKSGAVSNNMSFRDVVYVKDSDDEDDKSLEKCEDEPISPNLEGSGYRESTAGHGLVSKDPVNKSHSDDKRAEISSTKPTDTQDIDHLIKTFSLCELQSQLECTRKLLNLDLSKLSDKGERIKVKAELLTKAVEHVKMHGPQCSAKEKWVEAKLPQIECNHEHGIKYAAPDRWSGTTRGWPESLHGVGTIRSDDGVITDVINRLHAQFESCPAESSEASDPEGIKVDLLVHQRQALSWMTWRELQDPRGGILADDMGLGKTLTTISLILKQKQSLKDSRNIPERSSWMNKSKSVVPSRSTLVVCPASLVHQWEKEIKGRVDSNKMSVLVYHGPKRDKSISGLAGSDVVLTTYNIITSEVGEGNGVSCTDDNKLDGRSSPLLRICWQRIILDEGHVIKNHRVATSKSVCRLNGEVRWILTGTPIHNNLSDLYSLLKFLRCSPFDDHKTWRRLVDNKAASGRGRLNTLIKVLMLRRTKDQKNSVTGAPLVQLPQKNFTLHDISLSKEERKIYDKVFEKSKSKMQEYLKQQEEKEYNSMSGAKDADGGPKSNNSATQMLVMLLRLRQSCCHPHLMKEAIDIDDLKVDELEVDLADQLSSLNLNCGAVKDVDSSLALVFNKETLSTKIKCLVEVMQSVRLECQESNTKVKSVVVSQWTKMLEIVEHHLAEANFRCCLIRGDVPPKKRSEIVDDFNSNARGSEVMLLSLKAGGTGLNLIGGSHLYIVDLHWNPALEQQACDRVYRVGQKKNVFIHKFVCKDTIEEKIGILQQKKTELASNVLTGLGASSSKLTLTDLRILFGIESKHKYF